MDYHCLGSVSYTHLITFHTLSVFKHCRLAYIAWRSLWNCYIDVIFQFIIYLLYCKLKPVIIVSSVGVNFLKILDSGNPYFITFWDLKWKPWEVKKVYQQIIVFLTHILNFTNPPITIINTSNAITCFDWKYLATGDG